MSGIQRVNKFIGFSVLLLALSNQTAIAQPGELTLIVHGVREATGNLRVGLYLEPETFRKEEKALQVLAQPAVAGDVKFIFKDVSAGRYAIMAYHDENADGRLNLRLGMFPTEGYGLSNNPAVFGPPKFADSAFVFDGTPSSVEVNLNY